MLNGNVETTARSIINMNAIDCSFDSARNIPVLVLGAHSGSTQTIVDADGNATTQQVAYKNLLEWTDEFLKKYKIGARIVLNANKELEFVCYEGIDRTVGNAGNNDVVIFSQDFENLISSEYIIDMTKYKNAAVVSGEGVGLAKFADQHMDVFGRIQLIRKRKGADGADHFYRLDMTNNQVRTRVKGIHSNPELDHIFDDLAVRTD
jgi:hypothetical protein